MADNLTGVTEIASSSLEDIASFSQMYLEQRSLLIPTVTDYSRFAVKGAKSVDLPRQGGFTVNDKAENTAVDAQAVAHAADTITFDKHKVIQFLIEEIADNQSKLNVASENIMRASANMARQVDKDIITELKLASASAPDHRIVFADTTDDIVAKGDILEARRLLVAQYINPQDCFLGVGSEKEKEILNIDDFVLANEYGSSQPVMMGEIGRLYGLRVIVHEDFEDFMCTWHPTAVGLAFQRRMVVQRESDLANLAERWSLDTRYGVEVLDSGKRNVFTDSTN